MLGTKRKIGFTGGGATAAAPPEIVVFRAGRVHLAGGASFLMDVAGAQRIIAAHRGAGRDLPIDYDHATIDPNVRDAGGAAPAAGWIRSLRWDPARGLIASVTWTERGARVVASRQYRYHSPVFRLGSDGRPSRLFNLGLTNDPEIVDSAPIAASRSLSRGRFEIGEPQGLMVCNTGVATVNGTHMNVTDTGNGVIAAIREFGEAMDIETFRAALDETLIEAVSESFDGDDAEVLELLGLIVRELREGKTPRQVAGLLMQDQLTAAASRRPQGGVAPMAGSRGVQGPDQAGLRSEWNRSAELRREFGQYETFVAFRRAHTGGLVRIVGSKRRA